MPDLRIALDRPAVQAGEREQRGVLPRAVAPQRAGNHITTNHLPRHDGRKRGVTPAGEIRFGEADPLQPACAHRAVPGLGVVGAARERKHLRIESEALDPAVANQRPELERLRRRAEIGDQIRRTRRRDESAGRIGDRRGNAVDRLVNLPSGRHNVETCHRGPKIPPQRGGSDIE